MSGHTPTPWTVGNYDGRPIIMGNGFKIAEMDFYAATMDFPNPALANAEFIVRAVNAHDEMKEICALLISAAEANGMDTPILVGRAITKARAAIAKATGLA